RTGEELLQLAPVDLELAGAGQQGDAGDRALALAGRLEAGAALHLRRRAAGGGLLVGVAGELGLALGPLFLLGLPPGTLLGAQRPLLGLLDRDRLEVGAGDDVFFRLVLFLGLRFGSRLRLRLRRLGVGGGALGLLRRSQIAIVVGRGRGFAINGRLL